MSDTLEGERLSVRCLNVRARLAQDGLALGDLGVELGEAPVILAHDSSREDAHRMARLGPGWQLLGRGVEGQTLHGCGRMVP
jgi:hypothetical protein